MSLLSSCSGVMDEESFKQAPVAANNLEVAPASPSNNKTPTVSGITSASANIKLYSKPNCSGLLLGSGKADSSGNFSIKSSSLNDGIYAISILATDKSGGSTCSDESVDYILDTIPPVFSVSAPSATLVTSASAPVTYTLDYITTSTVNLLDTQVLLNATGTASCQIAVTDETTHNPIISLSSCTGSGSISLSIATGSATDSAGNIAGTGKSKGVVLVDNSGPISVTYDPATGTYQSVPVTVQITFNETIDGTSVDVSDFAVSGSCSTLPNLTLMSAIGSVVSVGFSGASCGVGETVILTTNLAGINDPAGNAGSGSVSATYTIDNVGPTSATFTPPSSRVSSIPATVTLDFTEAITVSSLTASDFSIIGNCATLPTLTVDQVSGSTATLGLAGASCVLDNVVTISLDLANVTDLNANAGSGSVSVTYTFDNIGPVATSINPVSASLSVMPTSVSVTFDENLLITSVVSSDLLISGDCSTLPTATLSSVSGATVNYALAGTVCSAGQTLTVTMNGSDVTDDAGNAGSGSVTATYTFDDAGPVVTSVLPASSNVNAIPGTVTFNFNESVLASSVVAGDVSVSGSCSTPPTVSVSSVSGSSAAFSLSGAACANGETLTLTLDGANVTDAASNAGSGSVAVTYTIDSVGPSPSSMSPITANYNSMPTTVTVNFDESVLASSVIASDLTIAGTCSILPTASVSSISGGIVTFSLAGANCLESQNLVLSVSGTSVTDTLGNAGANTQSVTYTLDTTGPSVLSFSPVTGATVSLPTTVTIGFDESVLAGSVAAADFSVSGTCNVLPIVSVSGVSGQQVFLSLSGASCDHNQIATITVNAAGISDLAGNAGVGTPAVSYTIDHLGPNVSSISPSSGAPPASVSVTFSENLDPSSVSIGDFVLGGTCATQTLSLNSVVNNVVSLSLSGAACVSGETVTLTINAANVTDALGNAGAGTSVVNFTEP